MSRPVTAPESPMPPPQSRTAAVPRLSRQFKDSFKLALSVVIAMGIALAMDWDRPYWAALAVVMCAFTASGDSLNKGLLRVAGTALAVVVTLTLVSLTPQSRWPFLFLISGWSVLCGYLTPGTSKGYFWTCAGFTVPILALDGGVYPATSFETVMLRAQETSLGVIVYSVVSYLIWPASSRGPFEETVGQVVEAERQAIEYLLAMMGGHEEDGTADRIRAQVGPTLVRLPAMLDGAELDSAEIRRQREAWRRIISQLRDIREAMARWHSSLPDVCDLDLASLLPGQPAFGAELDRRMRDIRRMLGGQAPAGDPRAVDLEPRPAGLAALPLFDRAALISCIDQMKRLDRLTASLFTSLAVARGFSDERPPLATVGGRYSLPVFDPDRFLYAMRAFFTLWLVFVMAIYMPDLPGVTLIVPVANSMCLALTMLPQVPATIVQGPVIRSLLFAGALYVVVMPRLSGFAELAVVLFLAVLAIAYRLPAATAPLARLIWLAMLVVCTGVANQQSYSFLHIANIVLPIMLTVWLVSFTGFLPVSYQPKDRFQHQLRRFFRSCSFLVSDAQWRDVSDVSGVERLRERFHSQEVSLIPVKMLALCGPVQAWIGPEAGPPAGSLVATLQGLRRRVLEVHAARAEIAPYARQLPEALRTELDTWRVTLHELFDALATDPAALADADLSGRLENKTEHLEARVADALNSGRLSGHAGADALRLYRLLAALRDMSATLVRFVQQAADFPWDRLRESRF